MNKFNFKKGFTLIELLVVIAIIGILSSVVLASLNSARNKASDTSVKADMANLRPQAELYYDSQKPNSYGASATCPDGGTFTGVFNDSNIKNAIAQIKLQTGTAPVCNSSSTGDKWALSESALKGGGTWCVDNSGWAKDGAAVAGQCWSSGGSGTGGNVSAVVIGGTTYQVHTFTGSGTFVAPTSGVSTIEVLVVAGGGGGTNGLPGGGGGGGKVINNASYSVTPSQSITVIVGGGGTTNSAGSNSVFGTITATGGSVGSGAGGGTSGQGNAGGTGSNNCCGYPGGGGGGAGAVGTNGTGSGTAGVGGTGLLYSISGSATYYGGGGGGGVKGDCNCGTRGAGGNGGGGAGGDYTVGPTAGTANTGGGGGGNNNGGTSGAGGSGIVIVRYPLAP